MFKNRAILIVSKSAPKYAKSCFQMPWRTLRQRPQGVWNWIFVFSVIPACPVRKLISNGACRESFRLFGIARKILDKPEWQKKGVLFGTSILVTPNNFNVVTSGEFLEELIKRGVFFTWYLTYKPVGDKLDLTLLFPPHQRHLLSKKVVDIRNSFPIIAIDHENDAAPIGGCLATNGIGIHINAKGGIEPCGILHYYDTFVKYGEAIEDSIKKSSLLNEMKSFNSSLPSCPLIDSPLELSEIIKKTFPETYSDLTDFKFLQEYIREYKKTPGHQERISTVTRKDIYTHLSEYILKTACS